MQMNPGIILSGQTVDVPNALMRGTQAAGAQQQFQQRNALFPLQMEGAQLSNQAARQGIEQSNALFPLQQQQAEANIELTTEKLAQIRQAAAQDASDRIRAGEAEQLAKEAAESERVVSMALAAFEQGGQAAADQILAGSPHTAEYVGTDPRVIGAGFLGAKDALEQFGGGDQSAWREKVDYAVDVLGYTPEQAAEYAKSGQTINVNTGNEVDPRPIVDKPDKGVQRVWDEENNTWLDKPIPGSEAQRDARATAEEMAGNKVKSQNQENEQRLKLGTTLTNINLNLDAIEDGKGLPVTGPIGEARRTWAGRMLTGSDAMDVQNRSDQITNSAALSEIASMRRNSPTGAAVGSLTDGERKAIGNAVTALNTATSPEEYARAAKAYRTLALDLAYGAGNWRLEGDEAIVSSAPPPPDVPEGIDPDLWERMPPEDKALWQD